MQQLEEVEAERRAETAGVGGVEEQRGAVRVLVGMQRHALAQAQLEHGKVGAEGAVEQWHVEHEDGEEIDVLDDIANSDVDKCGYCNEPYVGVEYPDGTRCGNCGGM